LPHLEQRFAFEHEASTFADSARGTIAANEIVGASFADSAVGKSQSGGDARVILGEVDEFVTKDDLDVVIAFSEVA
jgi:hypothetical protein